MYVATERERSDWPELPIVCPHCGNHGEPGGAWEANAWTPFKLVEEIVRSWEFYALHVDGVLRLTADTSNGSADRKDGTNLRLECMQCFELFAIPEKVAVSFE